MKVGVLVLRALVIDYVGDSFDIKSACRNLSCNEGIDLSITESPDRLFSRALPEIAMYRSSGKASLDEFVRDFLRGPFGAAEDNRRTSAFGLQNPGQHLDFVHGVGAGDVLFHCGHGLTGIIWILGPDVGRLIHELSGQCYDFAWHRC
ncbi:hypothetical protein GALL_477950 [mine drainage metagenome]|uniref:Uncharacterized protein n=1 Tax=mine drainage metagenome TaxID=410659 RepID=A0A1J5PGN4_9ZZZZ